MSIQAGIQELLRRLTSLEAWRKQAPSFGWGYVVQTDPLQVRREFDADPLPGKPGNAGGTHQIGDRVLLLEQGSRVTVISAGKTTPWTQLNGWPTGFTQSARPVEYRLKDGALEFRGALQNASFSGTTTLTGQILPAGHRPPTDSWLTLGTNADTTRAVNITPGGEFRLYGGAASGAWWNFDGLRLPID